MSPMPGKLGFQSTCQNLISGGRRKRLRRAQRLLTIRLRKAWTQKKALILRRAWTQMRALILRRAWTRRKALMLRSWILPGMTQVRKFQLLKQTPCLMRWSRNPGKLSVRKLLLQQWKCPILGSRLLRCQEASGGSSAPTQACNSTRGFFERFSASMMEIIALELRLIYCCCFIC